MSAAVPAREAFADVRNSGGGRERRRLAVIVLASLVLKLLLLIPAHSTKPHFDAMDYSGAAVRLLETGRYGSIRAPGYPVMMAAVFWASRAAGFPVPKRFDLGTVSDSPRVNGFDFVRLVQVALSTVSVYVFFLLVRRYFDERAALAAAAIFAFYPNLVAFSHYLWSETLFIFLMLLGMLTVSTAVAHRRPMTAVAAGLLFGVATLTREIGLMITVVVAAWVWVQVAADRAAQSRRGAWLSNPRQATVLAVSTLLAAAVVIAPWAARNTIRYGRLTLISATSGAALLFGATDDIKKEIRGFQDPTLRFNVIERDRRCGERAREIIAADPLGWVKRMVTINLPSFFQLQLDGPVPFLLVRKWGYGRSPAWLVRLVLVLTVVAYLALMATAVPGGWLAGERRFTPLLVGFAAIYVAAHAIVLGFPRHRLPLEVMAMPFAGFLVTRTLADLRRRMTVGRLAGILVTAAVLATFIGMSRIDRVGEYWRQAAVAAARK